MLQQHKQERSMVELQLELIWLNSNGNKQNLNNVKDALWNVNENYEMHKLEVSLINLWSYLIVNSRSD
jgi:hypothetical protein